MLFVLSLYIPDCRRTGDGGREGDGDGGRGRGRGSSQPCLIWNNIRASLYRKKVQCILNKWHTVSSQLGCKLLKGCLHYIVVSFSGSFVLKPSHQLLEVLNLIGNIVIYLSCLLQFNYLKEKIISIYIMYGKIVTQAGHSEKLQKTESFLHTCNSSLLGIILHTILFTKFYPDWLT